MKPTLEFNLNVNKEEAINIQKKLSKKVITSNHIPLNIKYIAGIDAIYNNDDSIIVAGVSILNFTTLEIIENKTAYMNVNFPYIPGLFAFRELPAIIKCLELIETAPDLIVCDGHGIAHPRRFGIASHLGVHFGTPTIGISKNHYFGVYDEPKNLRGSYEHILDEGQVIGAALRTQDNTKVIYTSIGHKVSLEASIEILMKLSPKYRLPEPIRQADQLSKKTLKTLT